MRCPLECRECFQNRIQRGKYVKYASNFVHYRDDILSTPYFCYPASLLKPQNSGIPSISRLSIFLGTGGGAIELQKVFLYMPAIFEIVEKRISSLFFNRYYELFGNI